MKRLKAILLLLICILLLIACDDSTVIENESLSPVEEGMEPQGYTYTINTSSKKYHTQYCRLAQQIKDEYRKTTTDIDFIIERGYTPCGSCIMR